MSEIIKGDHHTYPPVGRCIYCGTTEGKLSKEHIIPKSLNGGWVLPESSCVECQKKTSDIEAVCTREQWSMLHAFRSRFKLRSYRGWKGRDTITAEITNTDGSRTQQAFDSASFPTLIYGMNLPPAGILLGCEPTNKVQCELVVRQCQPSDDFKPSGPLVKLGSFRPTAFMQLLVKIGYAFAAAETGTNGLLPMLNDIILWRTDKSPYLVGGGQFMPDGGVDLGGVETDYSHYLQMQNFTTRGQQFESVAIHLFGQLGLPKYHVVVRHRRSS